MQWEVEWRLFRHLMEEHAEAFQPELEACQMEMTPVPGDKPPKFRVPKQFPDVADLPRRTGESQWQCDLFLQVHSVYMAAVCERERESMPVIGIAKDRQVLRGLNAILPEVKSMMCFGCAQIRTHVPLWQRMYEPGEVGAHRFPERGDETWNENHSFSMSNLNDIELYEIGMGRRTHTQD